MVPIKFIIASHSFVNGLCSKWGDFFATFLVGTATIINFEGEFL